MTTGVHHHQGSTDGVARPVVELELTDVTVAAGQSVRVKITLTNVGAVVETYQLTVLGPAAQWCSIVPSEVALFPGDQGGATLIIRPPASSSTLAGTYRVGILATSEVRRTVQTAAEINVTVPSFVRFRSTAPRGTIDFKGHTTVYLQLANEGNSTIDCSVAAADPDGILKIKTAVDRVTLKPTETTWIKTAVKGPLVLFGSSRTRSMNAEFKVVLDHFSGQEPESVPAQSDRLNLIQKPRFRIRLGLFGRLAILLVLLGVVATFVYSRIIAPHASIGAGAPNVPQGFVAQVVDDSQIVFTWQPATGATGYEIYAVGAAGDPTSSASASASAPAAASTAPSAGGAPAASAASPAASMAASASSSASASASGRSLQIVDAKSIGRVPAKKKASPSPKASTLASASSATSATSASPSASATASPRSSLSSSPSGGSSASASGSLPQVLTSAEASSLDSPVCVNCSSVITVTGAGTRAVLQPLPKVSQACYRIVAKAGNYQSLFSVAQCVNLSVVQARQSSAAASAASASASASASAASASASAAKVHSCPPVSTTATPVGPTTMALQWAAATTAPSGGTTPTCSPTMTVTGYEIQRQILSGWSDLPSQPSANDTAFEATGLTAGTKQCFRIKALDANGGSAYTSPFCGTLPASSTSSSASPSSS